jgi:hypothetical protein
VGLVATIVAAPVSAKSSNGLFLQVETDKATYRLGEPVQVRITIRNDSATEYDVLAVAPWVLSDLVVFDATTGQKVSASITPTHPGFASRVSAWDLTPGKSVITEYRTLGDLTMWHKWSPIAFWGYGLSVPGSYTIGAVPALDTSLLTNAQLHFIPNGAPVASNWVTIQVTN